MCGIAGIINQSLAKVKADKVLSTMKHRGPDGNGMFFDSSVVLLHSRLSVIDLSKNGKQPMISADGRYVIVFNGEIYNFQNLRKTLDKTYAFKSKTDTEVVLYAYVKWGVKCLEKFNGMFAFVIYDRQKRTFFGARDRMGEKPLKYYFDNKRFIFASEIKSILEILETAPEIDRQAVSEYLSLEYIPAPATGFKNIFKLPAASYFVFKNNKLEIKKYWQYSNKIDYQKTKAEWKEEIYELIKTSVAEKTVSDVKIGCLLSGGIDSSLVSVLLTKCVGEITTVNVGFEDRSVDESHYAQKVSQLIGSNHHTVTVNSKMMLDALIQLPNYYDEPFADNSAISTLLLSKFARKHMVVALGGDGGDENFAGYERYKIALYYKYLSKMPAILKTGFIGGTELVDYIVLSKITKRANIFAKSLHKDLNQAYIDYFAFMTEQDKKSLLNFKFASAKIVKDRHVGLVSALLNSDIANYLPDDLMYKIDVASMGYGLEVRSPFLDYRLIELTSQMPDKYKISFFDSKIILKEIASENKLLPEEILKRQKQGFVTPLHKWLQTDLRDYLYDQINTKKFKDSELFNDKALKKYVDNYYSNKSDYANSIYAILALAAWYNYYF